LENTNPTNARAVKAAVCAFMGAKGRALTEQAGD